MRTSAWSLLFVAVACTATPTDDRSQPVMEPPALDLPKVDEGGSSGTDGAVALKVTSITLNHVSANRPAWVETRSFDSPTSSEQAWASVEVASDEVVAVAMHGESGEIVDAQFVSAECKYTVTREPKTLTVPTDYGTIQAALDAARPLDTVRVLAGTYHERLQLRSGVRLIGAGARETILDGDGVGKNLIDFTDAHNALVSGFTLRNVGRAEGCADPLDPLRCGGVWYASAVYADGHAAQDADPCNDPSLYFSDNIVRDNDIGMMLYFQPRAVVRDNVFVENRVGFAANHHGGATALLAWNVFYRNEAEALAVSASFMDILNNVFVENGSVLRQEYCQRGRLRCNVLWENETLGNRAFTTRDGNLFADPLLSSSDYSLSPSSPIYQTVCASETQTLATMLGQCVQNDEPITVPGDAGMFGSDGGALLDGGIPNRPDLCAPASPPAGGAEPRSPLSPPIPGQLCRDQ